MTHGVRRILLAFVSALAWSAPALAEQAPIRSHEDVLYMDLLEVFNRARSTGIGHCKIRRGSRFNNIAYYTITDNGRELRCSKLFGRCFVIDADRASKEELARYLRDYIGKGHCLGEPDPRVENLPRDFMAGRWAFDQYEAGHMIFQTQASGRPTRVRLKNWDNVDGTDVTRRVVTDVETQTFIVNTQADGKGCKFTLRPTKHGTLQYCFCPGFGSPNGYCGGRELKRYPLEN